MKQTEEWRTVKIELRLRLLYWISTKLITQFDLYDIDITKAMDIFRFFIRHLENEKNKDFHYMP
jgi:hypothetical protein